MALLTKIAFGKNNWQLTAWVANQYMQLIDTIQSIYQNINKNAVSHNDSLYQCSNSTFHDDRFWVLFDWEPSLKRQLFKIFACLASQLDCLQSTLNKINIQKACICLHNTLKYYMNDYLYLHYWREALCTLWIAAASTITIDLLKHSQWTGNGWFTCMYLLKSGYYH